MFDQVEFLSNPNNWPGSGPKRGCAIKKYEKTGGFPPMENFGMLISVDGKVFTNPDNGYIIIFRDGFEPLAYASIEALVADGWEVD